VTLATLGAMASSGGPVSAIEYVISKVPDWSPWMGKNLFLAAIPVALAVALFRDGRRRTPLWWAGFVTFVAFLPNAPYVLADYRWLRGPWLNAWYQDRWRFLTVLPFWALYFGLGFIAFVVAVRLAQRYLEESWSPWVGRFAVVTLCLLSAIGIYLGRADLNSWSFITEPHQVLDVLTDQPSIGAILRIGLAFTVLLGGYAACVALTERRRRRPVAGCNHPLDGANRTMPEGTGAAPVMPRASSGASRV